MVATGITWTLMDNTAQRLYDRVASEDVSITLVPANADAAGSRDFVSLPLVATILVGLQILDGALTLTGMFKFGVSAEGNPLLRELMSSLGLVPGLILTKLLCIVVVLTLCRHASRITWLPVALSFVAAAYAICAIVPWSVILVSSYLG